ncbi:MAG: glycoside hydrolase family 95 protein, partial [Bacteroidales bacterium]|nr:glycoside hydrolase family 95 protein [Bacteroidales bacterium]
LYVNLFDAHPPFQIDGNFGATSGIAEMLMQSHEENTIRLLPALPSALPNGKITGLKARGNFEVDIFWEDSKLTKAIVYAPTGGNTRIVYQDRSEQIELKAGEKYVY